MLYLIDQSKLQYIFCFEGLQWYVISDRSVKVTFYFCYEGLEWCVIFDRSVKVTAYCFVMRVYSGMLYQIDQSKLQYIFCYEGLQ
jgi:hypothetical protein